MTPLLTDSERVDEIAVRLANKFLTQLFNFCNQKNYFVYVGSLAEIMDWSYEFFNQYDKKISDWKNFEASNENIYDAATRDEFLIAWGNERIQQFYIEHAHHPRKIMTKAGVKLFVENITR